MRLWLAITSAVIVGVSGPVLADTSGDHRADGTAAATLKSPAVNRPSKRPKPVAVAHAHARAAHPAKIQIASKPAPRPQAAPVPEPVGFLPDGTQTGLGTRYAMMFAGRKTASGDVFEPMKMTAAHRTLPMYTHVMVTNMVTGKSIEVTINDRGPFTKGRVIDLSPGAAAAIGLTYEMPVRVVPVTGHADPPAVLVADAPPAAPPVIAAAPAPAPATPQLASLPTAAPGFSAGRSAMPGPVAGDYALPQEAAASPAAGKLARGGDVRPIAKLACAKPPAAGRKPTACP